jgi:hypothetical protein
MISKFFKTVFGLFGVIASAILLTTIIASMQVGGAFNWAPLIVIGGSIAAILHRSARRKKHADAIESEVQAASEKRTASRVALNGDAYKKYDGHGSTIEMQKTSLVISRFGLGSFLTQGIKGEKMIPFHNITAVQFRDATKHMSGYIQFSLKGEVASGKGIMNATLDENTVMFTAQQSAQFNVLRDKIEGLVELSAPTAKTSPPSIADELIKLADLKDRGMLSETEFELGKRRLVG